MVHLGDLIRRGTHHEVHLTDTAGRPHVDFSDASIVVGDPPVLGLSDVSVDSEPGVVDGLGHVERMDAIKILTRELAILNRAWLVSGPERVDTVFQEEIGGDLVTKTHDAAAVAGVILIGGGVDHRVDVVQVLAEDDASEVKDLVASGGRDSNQRVCLKALVRDLDEIRKDGGVRRSLINAEDLVRDGPRLLPAARLGRVVPGHHDGAAHKSLEINS